MGTAVWSTLLTSRTSGEAIAEHIEQTRANTVQIVDEPEEDAIDIVRRAHPSLRIIQVIHVEDKAAIEQAKHASALADIILLDSGRPNASTRTLGGTGDVHDWSISAKIVEMVSCPVFLAGGLDPDNVVAAIAAVSPFGVDLCSGIRIKPEGYRLDPKRLDAFARALGH